MQKHDYAPTGAFRRRQRPYNFHNGIVCISGRPYATRRQLRLVSFQVNKPVGCTGGIYEADVVTGVRRRTRDSASDLWRSTCKITILKTNRDG